MFRIPDRTQLAEEGVAPYVAGKGAHQPSLHQYLEFLLDLVAEWIVEMGRREQVQSLVMGDEGAVAAYGGMTTVVGPPEVVP